MKIEIDFAKPDALRQMKRELEAALAAVESALKAFGPAADARQVQMFHHHPPLPENINGTLAPIAKSVASLEDLFHEAGETFTSKEWIQRGKASNIPESQVRNYIKELENAGRIALIQRGQGRRPSSYHKN